MNFLFLTGCLASGKDGVGDYTRALAAECTRSGHACFLMALNDSYVSGLTMETSGGVEILRLGALEDWKKRIAEARAFISSRAIERVSLQFVGYAFNAKGIIAGLGRKLNRLLPQVPRHLMFHELWIGTNQEANWKQRAVGRLQRACILRFTRQFRPACVHTSNGTYLRLLLKAGVRSKHLRMFGCIPVQMNSNPQWAYDEWKRAGCAITPATREKFWILLFFGALHPVWPPEPFFGNVSRAAAAAGKKVMIVGTGRLQSGEALWNQLTESYRGMFDFFHFGERSPERISDLFALADFGVATTPYEIIGKSATVAAMREHGLPVLVNRNDVHFAVNADKQDHLDGIFLANGKLDTQFPSLTKKRPASALPQVARQFLDDLDFS